MNEQHINMEGAVVLHEKAADDDLERLGKNILARIAAGDKAKTKADERYLSAGLQLIEAKSRVTNFEAFLAEHCNGLSHSRAYELIGIAGGRTTTEEVRAKTNERKKRHRTKTAAKSMTTAVKASVSVPERTPKKTQASVSQNALTEFKFAVDQWMSKMDAATKQKALDYATEKARA
jgi:hypothetical protein